MEPLYWLVVLAILLLIEIMTLGLTTIWFAGGTLVAFIASMAGANAGVQFLLFFIVSLLLLIFTRPIATKYINKNRTKTNYESIIGKEAKVIAKIDNLNQSGAVICNGQEWTARSNVDQVIEVDTIVNVVEISGVKLIVTEKGEN